MPTKVPFLKSSKRKVLEDRYESLISQNGALDDASLDELNKLAIVLGLEVTEVRELRRNRVMAEAQCVKERVFSSMVMTDEDLEEFTRIGKRHKVTVELDPSLRICRDIYRLEKDAALPPPIGADFMLDDGEQAYYIISSTWEVYPFPGLWRV
jgi:hypothetical protein